MNDIIITAGSQELPCRLLDTPTAWAILAALPISSTARVWGDEIYFPVDVKVTKEPDARAVVVAGELAFWVEGQCIAIGFGPTPISRGDEIRLAAETNIWAHTDADVKLLTAVKEGDPIRIEAA